MLLSEKRAIMQDIGGILNDVVNILIMVTADQTQQVEFNQPDWFK